MRPSGGAAGRAPPLALGVASEDVVPTLEALLLLPRERARAATHAEARRLQAPRRWRSTGRPPAQRAQTCIVACAGPMPPASEPERARRRQHRVLARRAGARIGDGQAGLGLGALTSRRRRGDGWSASRVRPIVTSRSTGARRPDGAEARGCWQAGVSGLGDTALDLTAGPAAGAARIRRRRHQSAGRGCRRTAPPPTTPPRLTTISARGSACPAEPSARARSPPFVGLDGEFALERPPSSTCAPDEPRLPPWTAGLVLGATVGTP